MLDTETKRRIDTARDILVGKVPDPKSQVEQITIALIYKFMDDMDAESEEFGGKRKFFADEFARYGWARLMHSGLGGNETLNLYGEAIARMPENPGIPLLFRDIFKNAYLPYRDPETLRMFLKVIDEFTYEHSERLGDAFEYLLSVLGSQGDAGQFRTPRHIIDFMVEILDPKKKETVLDPACGTAGFLISSYKHIMAANKDAEGNSTLTPDERARLAQNFKGYDISPDMVRLSLVNMYLHGFAAPHIYEYDTLTSQERWNDYADVILANPPFMSPKGGIVPHNRFSVQSKRSEVLFVDYMAEHLAPNGRAAIIVPEGIIFQSQNAYTQLRKMLVEKYLVAVISLPAGVFNPYSGVKTSILILDKSLAKKANTIGFFKVENDGFGLGAQRREIDKNDMPQVNIEISEYLRYLREEESVGEFKPAYGLIIKKEELAENGDYNLSGERYRESEAQTTQYPIVTLGQVITGKPQYGSGASKVPYDGKVRYVRITDITDDGKLKTEDLVSPSVIEQYNFLMADDLLVARSGSVGRAYLHNLQTGTFQYAGYLIRFPLDTAKVLPAYVYRAIKSPYWWKWIASNSKTGTLTNINAQQYASFEFPLPPLDIQKEIVAEIDGYQKVIDGARAVIDNYRPQIPIHPDWPIVELGQVIEDKPRNGYSGRPVDRITETKVLSLSATTTGRLDATKFKYLDEEIPYDAECRCRYGDIYLQRGNTAELVGTSAMFDMDDPSFIYPDLMIRVRADRTKIEPRFLLAILQGPTARAFLSINAVGTAGSMPKINQAIVGRLPVVVPHLDIQRAIISEIETEQALVNANRELISRMEKKIQSTLARVWGEDDQTVNFSAAEGQTKGVSK